MRLSLKFKKSDISILRLPEWYAEVCMLDDSDDDLNLLSKEPLIVAADNFDTIQAQMASAGWQETDDSVQLRKNIPDPNSYLRMESTDFDNKEIFIPLIQSTFEILSTLCFSTNAEERPFDQSDLKIASENLLMGQQFQFSSFRI